MKEQIKPGFFGCTAAADVRRIEFDILNEQFLNSGKKANILFFGDSITQNWDLNLYFNPNVLKINRGIGGDTTFHAASRFEADVLQLEPEIIVILLGFNDLFTIAPDLWHKTPGENPAQVIMNIENNFRNMLSRCHNKSVYICSVLPQSLCQPYDRHLFKELIIKTNSLLKDLCNEYNAEYVDYYSSMSQDDMLPDDMTSDGVHPNSKAYRVMAETLKEKIDILC